MIKGLYGCSCHPFSSWEECTKMHRQKFAINESVVNKCDGRIGEVITIHTDQVGFITVKYGSLESDKELEHVAQLKKKR